MQYAIEHHFYRHSVYGYKPLLITAMEQAMGAALPEDVAKEADRQGVLQGSIWRDGKELPGFATTEAVLAQEDRITGFAQHGRGSFEPVGTAARSSLRNWRCSPATSGRWSSISASRRIR